MFEWRDFTPYPTAVTSGLPLATGVELAEADGVLRVLLVIKTCAPEWASNGLGK
jgi:hypothetical protein